MSMSRRLFAPGAGQHFEEYNIAVASEDTSPGDWVGLMLADAPAAQGTTAGEHQGKTLGTSDWIECRALDTTSGYELTRLGCVVGKGVDVVSNYQDLFTDTTIKAVNGEHVIFMQFGIHPMARQVTGGSATEELHAHSVDFEGLNDTTPAFGDIGINLAAGVTYGLASAGDQHGAIALVRCR